MFSNNVELVAILQLEEDWDDKLTKINKSDINFFNISVN